MSLLIIDNYDSFTYNIVHALRTLGVTADVRRNDKITVDDAARYPAIIISPGPGIPSEAGIVPELLKKISDGRSKVLGVCLGHQAIGEAFGAKLINLPKVYHGLQTLITVLDNQDAIFTGLPEQLQVGRYHSWAIDTNDFPHDTLKITATDSEGHIMALRHQTLPIYGLQFHPESVLTPQGNQMIENWLKI
ncbi:MAG: aminodeoxychorismate/anthranilate synthase component II [Bacteroides sp.]|nr:aminodeoxychorismate/anthranilate synthase component II [Bacteroides sp.]